MDLEISFIRKRIKEQGAYLNALVVSYERNEMEEDRFEKLKTSAVNRLFYFLYLLPGGEQKELGIK